MNRIKQKCNSGHFLFRSLPIKIIMQWIMLKSIWFGQIEPSKKF